MNNLQKERDIKVMKLGEEVLRLANKFPKGVVHISPRNNSVLRLAVEVDNKLKGELGHDVIPNHAS